METIFLGYLGYSLKNIPKTFHLEPFPYLRYIQNFNFIILSRENCEGPISHFCFNLTEILQL